MGCGSCSHLVGWKRLRLAVVGMMVLVGRMELERIVELLGHGKSKSCKLNSVWNAIGLMYYRTWWQILIGWGLLNWCLLGWSLWWKVLCQMWDISACGSDQSENNQEFLQRKTVSLSFSFWLWIWFQSTQLLNFSHLIHTANVLWFGMVQI